MHVINEDLEMMYVIDKDLEVFVDNFYKPSSLGRVLHISAQIAL